MNDWSWYRGYSVSLPAPKDAEPANVYGFRRDKSSVIKRRLAAVLCADVENYSWHVGEDELGTLSEMNGHLTQIIEPEVQKKGGRIFKVAGDSFFAEFGSAVEALQCALDIQTALSRRNAGLKEGQRLEFRMGLNLGEVVVSGDDLFGLGVILAERLQGVAHAGGICVSEDFYRQAIGCLDVGFDDLGYIRLKNIQQAVRVFRTRPFQDADSHRSVNWSRPAAAVVMLAVLPFDNLSGDTSQGYLSDGITNDIITDLSKFSQLSVLASHTTFVYKHRPRNVIDVCRELGVRYVVEGRELAPFI